MTTDDAVEEVLDRLGSNEGPAIDPQFADRLDAALRATHVARVGRHGRSVWVPVAAGLAGLAALVVGVLLAGAVFTAGEPSGAVLAAADDTTIVEPGEAESVGRPGQRLPDGTRIIVGPSGEAVVDGVVLGSGAEAVITDGRVEVVVPTGSEPGGGAPTTRRPASAPGSGRAPDDSRRDTGRADDPDPGDREPPTTAPTGSTSTVRDPSTSRPATPSTTRPSSSTTTTSPERTPSSSTAPDTTPPTPPITESSAPTTSPATPALDLAATSVPPGRVRLDWVIEGLDPAGPTLAGFRIEAADGERVSTVVLIRSGSARTATIERLSADVSFRVHAVDDRGTVLVSSNTVTQPPR